MKQIFNRTFICVFVIIALFDSAFQFIPLLSDFSYEYAVVNSLMFFLILPYYFRKNKTASTTKTTQFISFLLLLLLPIVIPLLFGNACKCSLEHGLRFYFFIPFFTFFYALLFAYSFPKLKTKHFALIHFLFLLIFVITPLWEIYKNPTIYFYNPIVGYFPGTIYDKYIPLNNKFLQYRLLILIAFALIFILRKFKGNFVIAPAIMLIFALPIKSTLGFSHSKNYLLNKADEHLENNNFNIFIFYPLHEYNKQYLPILHNFYKYEIENFTKDTFKTKISSFVFLDSQQKQRLFGAPNADASKPWQSSIFITRNAETLKHELAHAYSAKYGTGLLKLAGNLNPALIEGFAVAVENNFYGKNIYDVAAALYAQNVIIKPSKIFTGFNFFCKPPSLGYLYAGAFVKYLIDTFGIEVFKKYYASDNFKETYHTPIEEAEKGFFAFLKDHKFDSKIKVFSKLIQENKQLYNSKCPHYLAKQLANYRGLPQKKRNTLSQKLFEKFGIPYFFFVHIENLIKHHGYEIAYQYLSKYESKFINSGYYLKFLNTKIYLAIASGKLDIAEKSITELEKNSPFIGFEMKINYYRFLIKNYNSFTKSFIKLSGSQRKNFLLNYLDSNFNPYLIAGNFKYFTIEDLNIILKSHFNDFDWATYYAMTDKYLKKLHIETAKKLFARLEKQMPENYHFEISELKKKLIFFEKFSNSSR